MKKEIKNLACPFCGAIIKGKLPENLRTDKMLKLVEKILKGVIKYESKSKIKEKRRN